MTTTQQGANYKDAMRLQESFTARAERKVLVWLAVRLPAWVNSDHLTLLGFASMFGAGVSYSLVCPAPFRSAFAVFFLALNWFGDSLDGTLARVRNRQRPRYGFYVDHMIDTFGGLFLMGGLALSGFLIGASPSGCSSSLPDASDRILSGGSHRGDFSPCPTASSVRRKFVSY